VAGHPVFVDTDKGLSRPQPVASHPVLMIGTKAVLMIGTKALICENGGIL